mmetsp:Transcript_18694/g.16556  ORF Transcript_18694/g.16556 Transcript_18694/m.16556 type:complete len:87 (+) Transcript_18694:282-542(+)
MGSIINKRLNHMANDYCQKAQDSLGIGKNSRNFMNEVSSATDRLLKQSQERIKRSENLCSPLTRSLKSIALSSSNLDKRSKSATYL